MLNSKGPQSLPLDFPGYSRVPAALLATAREFTRGLDVRLPKPRERSANVSPHLGIQRILGFWRMVYYVVSFPLVMHPSTVTPNRDGAFIVTCINSNIVTSIGANVMPY